LDNIYLSNLRKISGQLNVNNNTRLTILNIDNLNEIGEFRTINNPSMGQVTFRNISSIDVIQIVQSNVTQLGIVSDDDIKSVEITFNKNLDSFGFPNLTKVDGYVLFSDNGNNGKVSFPELTSIKGNCSFSGLSELDIGKLQTVGSDFSLVNNGFKNITIKTLKSTGDAVSINNNNNLENITFPNLSGIGGALSIQNNSRLVHLYDNSFPKLAEIDGAVQIMGPIDNVSFPSIKSMKGGFYLYSTGDIDCSAVKKNISSYAANKLQTCESNVKNSSTGSKGSSKSGGSDDSQSDAIAIFNPIQYVGILSTAALVAGSFLF
ncbi:hypothetical protein EV182_004165, partial [Spiromyces aspiralis]